MKTLVFEAPGRVVPQDLAEPKPQPGELLMRPLTVGVCFTDKCAYEGSLPPGALAPGSVMGHEFGGVVESIGEGVEDFSIGQRVTVDPRTYCGKCLHCRGGLYSFCQKPWIGCAGPNGGFAELVRVPATNCYPGTFSDLQGAATEPASFIARSIRMSAVGMGDNVVILGADDYGMLASHWSRIAGAQAVIIADPNPVRRAGAQRMGADHALDSSRSDFVSAVRELLPFGADKVFVALEGYVPASEDYMQFACDLARPQGTIVFNRIFGHDPFASLDPMTPWLKELTLQNWGNCFGEEPWRGGRPRGDWQTTMNYFAAGHFHIEDYGGQVFALADLKTKADVDEVFQGLPSQFTKAFIQVSK